MCVTDDIAYYLYRELEKLGKRVGEGIMVSGFDDKPYGSTACFLSCGCFFSCLFRNKTRLGPL